MKTIQTTFAWFCAVMLVISGVAALLLFNVEKRAFSAEAFQQAFERQDLYTRMPAILAGALQTSIAQNGNTDPFLTTLSPVELEAAITDLLPPEDLKTLSDETLDSVFNYLNKQTDSVSVSLLPIKSRLAGPAGADLVNRIINAQPDCTLEQLLQMGMGFFSGDIALCKPPEEMMGLIAPMIESQLQFVTTAIPDQVVLVSTENRPAGRSAHTLERRPAGHEMVTHPAHPVSGHAHSARRPQSPRLAQVVGVSLPCGRRYQRSCRLDRLSHPGAGHSRGDTKPGRLPAAHFDLYPGGNGQRGIETDIEPGRHPGRGCWDLSDSGWSSLPRFCVRDDFPKTTLEMWGL